MIRDAGAADCGRLTEIAFAAKRHWGYPEEYIERWSGELTIAAAYVHRHRVRVFEQAGSVVGFYSLVENDADRHFGPVLMEKGLWLDHMFIDPSWHRQGIGSGFFRDIDAYLAASGRESLFIFVEPNAAGF